MSDKRFVYILRSEVDPNRHYTGITSDVDRRLHWHNHGLGLIRFGGHLPKGDYDVPTDDRRPQEPAPPPAVR